MTSIPPLRFALLAGCAALGLGGSPAWAHADSDPSAPAFAPASIGEALAGTMGDASTDPATAPSDPAENDPQDAQATQAGPGNEDIDDTDANDFGAGGGEIIVRGQRLRGQLDVEQAPLLELNELDIAAEGVASIADLITQIENQTGSARGRGGGGRPVVLVNGIRVGSFREFANYPPEALARVEVFPEEVALRFGFPPDRRVINLILKESYRNAEVELEFEGPTRGGTFYNEQEIGFLQIADGARINVNLEANDTSMLTEDERDIIQTPGSVSSVEGDPDQAEYRSLINDSRAIEASISWAKAFINSGTSVSANLSYDRNDSRRLQGLNTVVLTDPAGNSALRTFGEDTPLRLISARDVFEASGSVTRPLNAFRLTSTFNSGLSEFTQRIDKRADVSGFQDDALAGLLPIDGDLPDAIDGGFDTAFTRSTTASSLTTLRGPLVDLPAGELLATFDVGYVWTNQESDDTRSGQQVDLTRGDLSTGVNLVIPITSRRNGFADALGSFTLNAQIGLNDLSDFGTLGDYTIGLNWGVFDNLDLSATYIEREVAPGLNALGAPIIEQVNTPVFDFTNGETVLATVITGGNPDLLAETQRDWRFAANWQLPFWNGARFTAEYIRNRSSDVTSGFPQITPEIEAAFPDRIFRDDDGRLIAVDRRAVTFESTRANRLQLGLNLRGSIGAGSRGGPPPGVRGGGRPGAGGPGAGRPASGDSASGRPGGPPPGTQGPPAGTQGPPAGTQAAPNPASGRPGAGAGADRRAAFMQFRNRICADDGLDVLTQLVDAIDKGEDVSAIVGDFNPRRLQGMLARLRGENGEIDPERLAQLRERMCSFDPASMGGASARTGAPNGANGDASGGASGGGQGDSAAGRPGGVDRASGGPPGGPPAGRPRGGGGFNPLAAQRQQRGFRYFLNLTHTIELDNQIVIAPGLDPLDQLDGQGTGAFGLPRHTSRLEGGIFGQGLGMRLSGRYTGSARLEGTGLPSSSDLFFDDLATFDIRIFADMGRLTGSEEGALKNTRITLRVDNIFDGQRRVTDANGDTPLNYQPFLIDPLGRYIGIDLRKLF